MKKTFCMKWLLMVLWSPMSFGIEQFCLHPNESGVEVLMIKNIGSKEALRAIGSIMESGDVTAYDMNEKPDQYFIETQLFPQGCMLLKKDETQTLTVNGKKGHWIPFVVIDSESFTSQYGLLPESELAKGMLQSARSKFSTQDIINYSTDPKAVVVYVVCPQDRTELCTLRIKHQNQWVTHNGKPFELKVLARSRREKGNFEKSFRLTKGGDTPQGIYHLWGTLFTEDRKFGKVPRIDIDGMQPPINFQHADSPNFTRIVPKEAFLDYWIHEFPLAFTLGRYLFRIHDNSVDPKFPDTYTTPETQKTFRASEGCINTGTDMEVLLKILSDLNVLTKEQIKNKKPYGRLENKNIQNSFLVVIDEP